MVRWYLHLPPIKVGGGTFDSGAYHDEDTTAVLLEIPCHHHY